MKPENIHTNETVDFSRKWHAMAAVGTGVFLATVDGSIINVSLPTLVRTLHTEFAVVQWVVLAYLLTITSTMAGIGGSNSGRALLALDFLRQPSCGYHRNHYGAAQPARFQTQRPPAV
jgi:hypothetical protein